MHIHEPATDTDPGDAPVPQAPLERIRSELSTLHRATAAEAMARIALGERPVFRVHWRWDGTAVEIAVEELPGVNALAPTRSDVECARSTGSRPSWVSPPTPSM